MGTVMERSARLAQEADHKFSDEEIEGMVQNAKTIPAEVLILQSKKAIPDYTKTGAGRGIISEATNKAQRLVERMTAKIISRNKARLAKMDELANERNGLCIEPWTKADLLAAALAALAVKKDAVKKKILTNHLALCQLKKANPLQHVFSRFSQSDVDDLHFLSITEEDIKAAIDSLPDVEGLSAADFKKRAKALDDEITKLADEITTELEQD